MLIKLIQTGMYRKGLSSYFFFIYGRNESGLFFAHWRQRRSDISQTKMYMYILMTINKILTFATHRAMTVIPSAG